MDCLSFRSGSMITLLYAATYLGDTQGSIFPSGWQPGCLVGRWGRNAYNKSPEHHGIHTPCICYQSTEPDPEKREERSKNERRGEKEKIAFRPRLRECKAILDNILRLSGILKTPKQDGISKMRKLNHNYKGRPDALNWMLKSIMCRKLGSHDSHDFLYIFKALWVRWQ